MTFNLAQIKAFSFRYKRQAIIVGVCVLSLFIIFSIIGMIFLPGVIKDKAIRAVEQELHRKLTIQDISFNPFSLSVALEGVKLRDRDSEDVFVSLDKLYVNVSTFSAFTFYPIIREVEVVNPYVYLCRNGENTYNISDIIEMALKPDDEAKKDPLSYSINNIQITGGKIIFEDKPNGAQHKVEDLTLRVPYFSSAPSNIGVDVEPYLGAKINGSKIELTGKTHPLAENKETDLKLNFKKIHLPRYMEYLPYKPNFQLADGDLNVDLTLHFIQSAQGPKLTVSGDVSLDTLNIRDLAHKPLLGFEKLLVRFNRTDVFANDFQFSKIELTRPSTNVLIDPVGKLNLLALAPQTATSDSKVSSSSEKSQMKFAIKEFVMKDAQLFYSDLSDDLPYSVEAKNVNFMISDVNFNLGKKALHIGKVVSDSASFLSAIEKERKIKSAKKSRSNSTDGPMLIQIDHIDLSGWSTQIESTAKIVPTGGKFTNLSLLVRDFSTEKNKKSSFDLKADVEKKGYLLASGQFGIFPLYADIHLDVKDVSLVILQMYIDQQMNLTLIQGDLTTKGNLNLAESTKGELKGSYKGDVSVNRLVTTDQIKKDTFVRWDKFALNQMKVNLAPFSFSAKHASLNNLFARLILSSEGRLNVQNILRSQSGGQKSLTAEEGTSSFDLDKATQPQVDDLLAKEEKTDPIANETQETSEREQVATKEPISQNVQKSVEGNSEEESNTSESEVKDKVSFPPIKIDRILISNGRVHFSDHFIKPNYTATLENVHGAITRVSSHNNASAVVDLKGKVNRAPLTIVGNLTPFDPTNSLSIKAAVKGMELAQFSSYTSKYVGYGIEKGKLSFDVEYKVENGELSADNHLILNQLTFGDKSTQDPVMSLPVQFAVNLLKDGDGVIDLNLPISGSLNDPQFSIGGIVIKVIVNLLRKAVTAPFSLLSAAFGGGEELSFYEFIPGKSDIRPETEERLANIAKALKNRPALNLDITGCYDSVVDRTGAAKLSIDRKVREMKRKDMGSEGAALRLSDIKVSDKEYAKYLKEVYSDSDFKKPRNFIGFQKSLPQAEMEKLIYENYPISEEEFMALADKRAANTKAWFIDKGQIPQERIFIHASKSKSGENSTRADFSLH